jgi:ABC-type polysaccharide/polyol phosphate transport system ATPase subunit
MNEISILVDEVSLSFPKKKSILNIFKKSSTNDFLALDKIRFSVNKGEVLGIIGRNGCGKSTLLRVIAGIFRPDEGQCKSSGKISLLAGLGTGFTGHLTGRQNAFLYGSILGNEEKIMKELMPEIISFSELESFIDEPLRTYSAGMKARLGLAVASALNPEILLIDEVLGVGDPVFKEKSKAKILDMVAGAGTVVLVSHSFGLMTSICDRVIHMSEGKICFDGNPKEAIESYYESEEKRN